MWTQPPGLGAADHAASREALKVELEFDKEKLRRKAEERDREALADAMGKTPSMRSVSKMRNASSSTVDTVK